MVDYNMYRFMNHSTGFNEFVLSFVSKTVEVVKLQIQVHFFNSGKLILIAGFFAIWKVAYDTNQILEMAARSVLLLL